LYSGRSYGQDDYGLNYGDYGYNYSYTAPWEGVDVDLDLDNDYDVDAEDYRLAVLGFMKAWALENDYDTAYEEPAYDTYNQYEEPEYNDYEEPAYNEYDQYN